MDGITPHRRSKFDSVFVRRGAKPLVEIFENCCPSDFDMGLLHSLNLRTRIAT